MIKTMERWQAAKTINRLDMYNLCVHFGISLTLPLGNKISEINEAIAKQQDHLTDHQGTEEDAPLIKAMLGGKYLTDLQVARLLYIYGLDVSANAVDNINNLMELMA